MKEKFSDFINLCKKSIIYDSWALEGTIESFTKELLDETEELRKAVLNNDRDNFREELGDVLCNWVYLCLLAEKQGHFTIKEVISDIEYKLERRKPYLLEGKKVSKEQALQIWQEVKTLEKIENKNKRIIKIDENKDLLEIK